jgi:hypothetical protein
VEDRSPADDERAVQPSWAARTFSGQGGAALLEDGRAAGTQIGALIAVRSFLLWARAQELMEELG